MPKKNTRSQNGTGATLGIENELWEAADKLRGHLDAAEYKSVVLGLIFLKYVSDMFEQVRARVEQEAVDDPEDRDVYLAERVFWVPKEARWKVLQDAAKQESIGNLIDAAMESIEKDNPTLKGMLPGNYGRATLDKRRLGDLVDLVSNKINFADEASRKQDTLGRVYEYFLSQFASQEGRKGGEFYTPRSVVRVLVTMLAPYKGRVFDPCCGSGGMFVQSEKFVEAHGGKIGDLSVYGQESNPNTFKLAKMNLAIRGIEGDLGQVPEDSFHHDQHPDLKADYVLANPPFNMSDWGGEGLREDKRWKYGKPPVGNANFAWVQHFIHHLSPNGAAGFVLANSSTSSNQSGEHEIRKNIIDADLVDCIVALPGHLFYSMHSQVCLWFLARNKHISGFRDRRGETLFIDARNLGTMAERTHRDLTSADISKITLAYKVWTRPDVGEKYQDVVGFCRSVRLDEIKQKKYNLTPGRYVGSFDAQHIDIQTDQALEKTALQLKLLLSESERRAKGINANFRDLGIAVDEPAKVRDNNRISQIGLNELNHRLGLALTDFAKILFKSWFVDFEPTIAKSEGETLQVTPFLADLFPAEFEDSPLGEIPKGWRVGTYNEILTPTNIRMGNETAPEYSATVRGLELREVRFNKSLAKAQTKNKRIEKNDLVFGLSRKVLNFGLMTQALGSVSPVYEVFHVNVDKYVPELLELYIRYHMHSHIDILKPGAREGQPIDREYLLTKELLIPDISIQQVFLNLLSGVNVGKK